MFSPLKQTPWSRLEGFSDEIMRDVATVAAGILNGNTGTIDRSQCPYYFFGTVEFEQVPPALPAMRWKAGDAHFERIREMGSPAPNPVTGSIGSWMTDFHVRVYGNNPAEAYNELNTYLMPALERQFSLPPLFGQQYKWEPMAAENNGHGTIAFQFTAPIKVDAQPYQFATINVISASIILANEQGVTGSINARHRVIT